uniref:Uncharacterized protein n=1 Tax=Ditylenchus dipsaci TaxID=166011 RepID=A0A915D9A1_9BILA
MVEGSDEESNVMDTTQASGSQETEPTGTVLNNYFDQDTSKFSPAILYRPQNDVISSLILQSSSEGIGKYELGKKIGINTRTKHGERRVAASIQSAIRTFSSHFGQFQKMEGKYRMIKYHSKCTTVGSHNEFNTKFEELTGVKCPFKMGAVIKFPNTNLNTLRISDITMKRMLNILQILNAEKVIVTSGSLLDKKSAKKCVLALQKQKLCKVSEAEVLEDGVKRNFDVIVIPQITSITDPLSVPNWSARYFRKRKETDEQQPEFDEDGNPLPMSSPNKKSTQEALLAEMLSTIDISNMSVMERFALFRQVTATGKKAAEEPLQTGGAARVHDPVCLHGENRKSVYELFPPTKPAYYGDEGRPDEQMQVFDEQDGSPYRFVPAQPKFNDASQGWFLIRDLVSAMPLSIFMVVVNIKEKIPGIEILLKDPIKRHTLIGDLHSTVRVPLMTKRYYSQVEYHCLVLCAMGLMRVAPNLDGNRSSIGAAALFYLARQCRLYDTSTSEKGYATVTIPLQRYKRYEYEFRTLEDVQRYWNHLKAIAYSTPLNMRNDYLKEEVEDAADCKKYSFGSVDRMPFFSPFDIPIEDIIEPPTPINGCGGFDPSLFIHITRQWELSMPDVKPGQPISETAGNLAWLIQRWKQAANECREWVLPRVEKLDTSWGSFVGSLMPSDGAMFRKKRKNMSQPIVNTATSSALLFSNQSSYQVRVNRLRGKKRNRASLAINQAQPEAGNITDMDEYILQLGRSMLDNEEYGEGEQVSQPSTSFQAPELKVGYAGKRKRRLDEVDLLCQKMSTNLRSKFTPRERDMLVLIRAVSFFLNPVHRFWLDPTVMREVMHQYVPESRNKTANSLMAAGARDLIRHNRLSHLHYIVKTLGCHEEMRHIRNEMAKLDLQKSEEKNNYFLQAFEMAFNLLFKEDQNFPSISAPDTEFEKYIENNHLVIGTSIDPGAAVSTLPDRSSKPMDAGGAQHCIGYNVITSILLNESNKAKPEESQQQQQQDNLYMDSLLNNINVQVISDVLELARSDGLLAKNRPGEGVEQEPAAPGLRNQAVCSAYYRHFLNHCYHNNIISMTNNALNKVSQANSSLANEDDAGIMLILMHYLENKDDNIKYTVPNSLNQFFKSNDEDGEKKKKRKGSCHQTKKPLNFAKDLPEFEATFESFIFRVPIEEMEVVDRQAEASVNIVNEADKINVMKIFSSIEASGVVGLTEEEISLVTFLESSHLSTLLKTMQSAYDIFPCGIDTRRPWTLPKGDINFSVLKWMAEAVLVSVHSKPGILVEDLVKVFVFALQPILVEELLGLLQTIGCCTVHAKTMSTMKKTSPFAAKSEQKLVKYAMPKHDGLEKFALFFKNQKSIQLL